MRISILSFRSILFLILLCFTFNSCSSFRTGQFEKRHYRNGFYFDRSTSKVSETNTSVHYEAINTKQLESSITNTAKLTSEPTLIIPVSSELNKAKVENENSIAAHVNTAYMDSSTFFAKHTAEPYSYIKVAPSDSKRSAPSKNKHTFLIVGCVWGFLIGFTGLLVWASGVDKINAQGATAADIKKGNEKKASGSVIMIVAAVIFFICVIGDLIHSSNAKKQEAVQQEQEQNAQWQNQMAEAKYQKEKKTKDSLAIVKFEVQAKEYRAMTVKPSLSEEGRKYIVQATALTKEKQYEDAIAYYAKASAVDPTYPPIYYNVALLLATLERYESAIFQMKKYLMLDPDSDKARSGQDKIYAWEVKVKK